MNPIPHEFYGYKMVQNPSQKKLSLYVGAINAKILSDIVSVDNAVKWDPSSNIWREEGRNRSIEESHVKSIREFLSSSNVERIMPNAIVISVKSDAFTFSPFPKMNSIDRVKPGILKLTGRYNSDSDGNPIPVEEKNRSAWVLDGQHRISAFREWNMPKPYPVNVIILKAWAGGDYEDVMRHQTYELNMGRPLSEDFKAAIREQYNEQVGHKEYKKEIAISWIRKDLEDRGAVFSRDGIVGAAKLRTPYVVTMSFVEKLISLAFDSDSYLRDEFSLERFSISDSKKVGKYLFDFYEGVRLSIGLINPLGRGNLGMSPEVAVAVDYWDIALNTNIKQRLLHNVGLKAITKGLLNPVMRGNNFPDSPAEVAKTLDHMRGIPWGLRELQSKKDDWVIPLEEALKTMFKSKGTSKGNGKYILVLAKKDKMGNPTDALTIQCDGWKVTN